MDPSDFRAYISDATAFLRLRIARAKEHFGIGTFERYDYDLDSGRFWWSNAGVPQVEARLITVGSVSTDSGTWLWANPSFAGCCSPEIERVRAFGAEHDIFLLVEPKWPADETDGWEMTSVSARILDAEAAYRSSSANGFLFLLLNQLQQTR